MTNSAPMAAVTEKAGWWTRFFAILIDSIGLGIITGIISGILYHGDPTAGSGLQTLLGVVYFCYFWSSYGGGQTLGMRALNIRVVKTDGSQLDIVGAFSRQAICVVGDFVLDEFVSSEISRVSREAPVLILRHRRTEVYPGGAANAVNNLADLGARVLPVGVGGAAGPLPVRLPGQPTARLSAADPARVSPRLWSRRWCPVPPCR